MNERITSETETSITAVFDPHDGKCHGMHDVIARTSFYFTQKDGVRIAHVVTDLSWAGSAFLSPSGSEEFAHAILHATERSKALGAKLLATYQAAHP